MSGFVEGLVQMERELHHTARYFVGTLTTTGELYLIPAEHRQEWHTFDAEAEETSEVRPVPEWARPMVGQLEHLEFEMPKEMFA